MHPALRSVSPLYVVTGRESRRRFPSGRCRKRRQCRRSREDVLPAKRPRDATLLRRQNTRWFVEDQDARFRQQQFDQLDLLLLADRQLPHVSLGVYIQSILL